MDTPETEHTPQPDEQLAEIEALKARLAAYERTDEPEPRDAEGLPDAGHDVAYDATGIPVGPAGDVCPHGIPVGESCDACAREAKWNPPRGDDGKAADV